MSLVETELINLKQRVEHLENVVGRLAAQQRSGRPASHRTLEPLDPDSLLAWLKGRGVVREPTLEELRLAAEWEAMSEDEKQAIRFELDHLPPGPMASDIIIQGRQ